MMCKTQTKWQLKGIQQELFLSKTFWSEVKWSKVTQSCLTLWDPMDCSPPGSLVHGISQARMLEWVAIPFSRGSSWPRDRNSHLLHCRRFFTTEPPGNPSITIIQVNCNKDQSIWGNISGTQLVRGVEERGTRWEKGGGEEMSGLGILFQSIRINER